MMPAEGGVFVKGKFYDFGEINEARFYGPKNNPIFQDICCPEFSRIWNHAHFDEKHKPTSWLTFHCGEPKEGNELVCLNPKSQGPAILLRPDWCPLRKGENHDCKENRRETISRRSN